MGMGTLILRDSEGFIPDSINYSNASAYIRAVDELNAQFDNGEIDCIHLFNYGKNNAEEHPLEISISEYTTLYSNPVPHKCRIDTSHYIGSYGNSEVSIRIEPRFGKLFSYFLGFAANVFLPAGEVGASSGHNNPYWLIALLWKSMLNSALTSGQIPKTYIEQRKNLRSFRGKLDVLENIRLNSIDQSKFFCVYRKLSMDNTINRAIRHTYRILKNKGLSNMLADLSAYDARLASLGVDDTITDVNELDRIRYTKINAVYQPVINICKSIINNELISPEGEKRNSISYIVDVAELWEMFLLRLLQRNLSSEYYVYSPNSNSGDFLLQDGMREIRPDILIEKNNRVLLVIDAKYKRYFQIGRSGSSKVSVQRDDLYQMNTYLYHYGSNSRIAGVYTSPVAEYDVELHYYTNNPHHCIGLVNLDIEGCGNDMAKIHLEESKYIERIKRLLEEIDS